MNRQIAAAFIAFIILVGSAFLFFGLQQDQIQEPVPVGPTSRAPQSPPLPPNNANGSPDIVGNDRDAHGCIGSAGYTWCEQKQKCLRTWEEPCADNNNDSATGGTAGMANPASVYCEEQGGKLTIEDTPSGQTGICTMPNGTKCEEWDFFRTKVCKLSSSDTGGDQPVCARENCHGLEIKCGSNPAQVCTEIYELGDKCLQYAKCGIVSGTCQQISDPAFNACKICVQNCVQAYVNDQMKLFDCESKCG